MLKIKKILFPVDFSERCVGAARYVEALAGRFEAELTLLAVVDTGTHAYPYEALPVRQKEVDAFLIDELKYFKTRRLCVVGDPAEKIAEEARSWGADLVMIPTHGLGLFRRFLLGSVAAKVLHDIECPVWTSVHAEQAPPLEKITLRHIMCAVDLGENSRRALDWAASLAGEYDADLGIVHALPKMETGAPSDFMDQALMASVEGVARQRIADLQAAAGTNAQAFIQEGDPAKIAACAAKAFQADMVVIGRHAGTGVNGRLHDNAYAILRESPCPVISI